MKRFDWLAFAFGVWAMVGYNLARDSYDLLTSPRPPGAIAANTDTGLAYIDGKATCVCQGVAGPVRPQNLIIAPGVGTRSISPLYDLRGLHDPMPLGPVTP